MEDTDGGLHPAVDGQSLDEDEDEDEGKPSQTDPKRGSIKLSKPCFKRNCVYKPAFGIGRVCMCAH